MSTATDSRAINPGALYTADEAARLLSVHVVTLRRLLRAGVLRGRKIGGWRISGAELLRKFSA